MKNEVEKIMRTFAKYVRVSNAGNERKAEKLKNKALKKINDKIKPVKGMFELKGEMMYCDYGVDCGKYVIAYKIRFFGKILGWIWVCSNKKAIFYPYEGEERTPDEDKYATGLAPIEMLFSK